MQRILKNMLATAHQLPPGEPEGRFAGFSVLEFLEQFRKRVLRACLAVAVGVLITFTFIDRVVNFVLAPTRRVLPPGSKLIYTQPGEAFSLYIMVGLLSGVVIASPFIMFQLWRLVAPALYANEKKLAIPFVLLTTSLAIAGAAFNHYIIFPYMIAFFGTFGSASLVFLPRLEDAFDLYAKMMLGMMAVFQIPPVTLFLARMGLVTPRWLWRQTKYAILIIFIVAAVLTPSPDAWTQIMFATPMIGLYLISILVAWIFQAPKRPSE
jgi:sec-independent protein translocase protein TatC